MRNIHLKVVEIVMSIQKIVILLGMFFHLLIIIPKVILLTTCSYSSFHYLKYVCVAVCVLKQLAVPDHVPE
jgi:hypothetical protein